MDPRALLSAVVSQLLPLFDSLSICDRQDFVSAVGIDYRCSTTNSPHINKIIVGGLVTQLKVKKLISDRPSKMPSDSNS